MVTKDLLNFVERSMANGSYSQNTAYSNRAAIRLFDKELSDAERNSLAVLEANFKQIYKRVFDNNRNLTNSTLYVYRSRVLKLIKDYKAYGLDPIKMSSWTQKSNLAKKRERSVAPVVVSAVNLVARQDSNNELTLERALKIEISLPSGPKYTLSIPYNSEMTEATILKAIIDSLV